MPEDSYSAFDVTLARRPLSSPWVVGADGDRRYVPDYRLLEELLAIPIRAGQAQASGRFAKAIDAWCAQELRRAGFESDEVWPRASQPRVLPREVGMLIEDLPSELQGLVKQQLLANKKVAPSEATILGRVFVKQADVLVAQWSRGVEILVSTKSMLSSFGKNLRNRFEESYGDAKNLRGRFPLASMGFLYLLRSTISTEPASWELALDMLRKLREDRDGYDATALLVAEWSEQGLTGVRVDDERVPPDLRANQLMSALVSRTLERTPVQFHVRARELRDQRQLPLTEGEQTPAAT